MSLNEAKPPFNKLLLWAIKRKKEWTRITGVLKREGESYRLFLDNDLTYSEQIGLPAVNAHWAEIPENPT